MWPIEKRLWSVVDGCTRMDDDRGVSDVRRREWALLVARLLPATLPDQVHVCADLIRSSFRGAIPNGILQAVCSLVSLRHEQQARAALVDFLAEKHDAVRLQKLLRMQLLFMERAGSIIEPAAAVGPLRGHAVSDDILESDAGWEWEPEEEPEMPDVDDDPIRNAAAQLQASIGAHRVQESGSLIPGFEDMSEEPWTIQEPDEGTSGSAREDKLVQRTLGLGPVALDLLRYFSDNPGDKSFHAELVLGYPVSDINRLLTGSLSHHVTRSPSGGWQCHGWVADVLGVLDGSSS